MAFGQGCGVLNHAPAPGAYRHLRYTPPAELSSWVQHIWLESWCFGETPQRRELLPHPCVQLAFLPGTARIFGVQRRRFVRDLKGSGRIIGIKFLPGAFYPFLCRPVSALADTSLPAAQIFAGAKEAALEISGKDDAQAVQLAAEFLMARLPAWDASCGLARRAVDEVVRDAELTRVSTLSQRMALSERNLQRLFHRYVGASPGWVIKRYRMYEAIERLGGESKLPLTDLAHNLGYFDQAHFSNDFKKTVGQAPAHYARRT